MEQLSQIKFYNSHIVAVEDSPVQAKRLKFFLEENGKIFFQNASQVALRRFQEEMTGEATKAGFESEEDVVRYIKDLRSSSGK